MSQFVATPTRTFQAAAAIAQFLRVRLNGSNKLAVCGAGASENELGTMEVAALAADEYCAVRLTSAVGTVKMVALTAFSQEALVYAAAGGYVDDVPNGKPIGIALEAATAVGDVVEILRVSAQVIVEHDDAVDDAALSFGTGTDAQMLFSTGDASNHTFVLALDNTSQQMHVTDVGAKATDWARTAGTHPELAIHSNTTPATDYLALGNHDGTTASINVVGGTTLSLAIAGVSLATITASGISLVVDDDCFFAGASADCGFGFMDADASNPAMVIFVDDTAQQVHITDKGAKDTDWARSAGTHPELAIHSNTTPATDYLALGNHDGTTASIDVVGGTTLDLDIAGTTALAVTAAAVTATGRFVSTAMVGNTAGVGITGTAASFVTSVEHFGTLIKTTIIIDLAGLNSGGTADDVIGADGAGKAHLGRITAAVNGTIISGKLTCLETPATGDNDINVYSATEDSGVEDTAIDDLTKTALCNSGDLAAGTEVALAAPAADQYLYLTGGIGDCDATYSAGILMLEFWGK